MHSLQGSDELGSTFVVSCAVSGCASEDLLLGLKQTKPDMNNFFFLDFRCWINIYALAICGSV